MSKRPHVSWVRFSPRTGENLGASSIDMVAGLGIEGDRHAKPDRRNQVLLIEAETLKALGLGPGDVRENIATRGIQLMELSEGDLLQVGPQVELLISHPCEPCHKMDALRPGLRQELEGRRGMLAIVTVGGVVAPGDEIRRAASGAGAASA